MRRRNLAPADAERLRLALRIQLRRHSAHDAWLQPELAEYGADFLDGHRRLLEVQIDDVVIAIDLVTQARHRLELMVELQDFLQLADTGGVDFDLDHKFTL